MKITIKLYFLISICIFSTFFHFYCIIENETFQFQFIYYYGGKVPWDSQIFLMLEK